MIVYTTDDEGERTYLGDATVIEIARARLHELPAVPESLTFARDEQRRPEIDRVWR